MSGPRWDLGRVVGSVSIGRALAFRVRRAGQAGGGCVFRDIGRGEFDLGFLFQGRVGRRNVGGEGVCEVLLLVLFDSCRERCEGRRKVIGDGKSDLCLWLEWFREVDDVVLGGPNTS